MPSDDPSSRVDAIRADLAYFKKAVASMGVGSQPPTVYADKYAQDVEFLLDLLTSSPPPLRLPKKSDLESALEHDALGRTERNPKRG